MSSIVDIIQHYQKSIDRSLNDEARLVHCIGKLYRLPVSVQHLQETGIGRTVNGLRKYDGEVGVAAKALVSKWKNMVAAEESDTGEPEPQHQDHEEEDEDNYDESCLQVDEDRHSDEHQEEEDQDEEEQHQQQEEESDNQEEEEVKTPQQATNGHDSDDHRSARSSHRDSDRHRSSSSSKHKSDRHSHRSSSSSKDGSRSRDRHEKHRDGEKSQHHNSNSSSSTSSSGSKGHSSSPSSAASTKKSSRHENEGKEKKDKHSSSRKESSQANGKESSHSSSSSKEKPSSSDNKHHSKSKDSLNGFTKEDESHKRRRASEDEEESAVKKVKNDQPSESKSKSSSKSSSSSGSSSSKDRSSSKSAYSSGSSKEKDKNRSSEKKKESSSKRKSDQPPDNNSEDEDDDNGGGASFADALAMIGMPSTSKKKGSSKGSVDKIRTSSSSSMPPPPVKSDKHRSSSSKRSVSPSSTASSSGYSSCSSTPSLLAQKPKLAPLQIAEIVESLPMISPHYKPMPLNQTVMECVFSNNGKPQKRPMTEEEALGHSMQSKNLRTKVYSGVKTYNGEVPTLYNLCIRLLQEHIDLIDYTGGIPFDLLKPVLERASPDQLFTLENYNPYLMEDSDVLWEQHCRRNFRSQKRKEEECEAWREMFIRCSEERETKLQSLTANIKQSQVAKAAPIRKTQLAYVDSAVKPPRSVISKQVRYGTAQAPVVSPAARVASLKNATTNVTKAGDSRLKVAAGIRDTAQAQVFHPTKPKKAPLMSKVMQSIKGFKGFRR